MSSILCLREFGSSAWPRFSHRDSLLVRHLKVPVALTLEIFGDETAPNEDCYRMFNPTSHDQLEEVVSKWTAIFFSLLANLPTTLVTLPSRITADTNLVIQDSGLLKQFESLSDQRKLGRVWQGMDPSSEGLRTPDLQASLQFYLFFCALLLLLSWLRCSKHHRRFSAYIRPSPRL